LGLLFVFAALAPSPAVCYWDLRTNLWGPAQQLVQGLQPYTLSAPYGPFAGVWMPWLIGAAFPLGWLSCEAVSRVWLMVEALTLVVCTWYAMGRKLPPPWLTGVILLLLLFFPPLYYHINLGQYSLVFGWLVLLAAIEPKTQKLRPILLALAAAKPQLIVLVYPGIWIAEAREKGFGAAVKLAGQTLGAAALLTLPLFLFCPRWVEGFTAATRANLSQHWAQPTLFVLLRTSLGGWGLAVWGILLAAALGAAADLWLRHSRTTALFWSLALTPMITPYAFSWDFVLILPLLVHLLVKCKAPAARGVLIVGALLIDGWIVAQRWNHPIADYFQWWIPPALLLVCLLAVGLNTWRRKEPESEGPDTPAA
jgi:hypothetical protein